MRKIQDLATIKVAAIPEALREKNEEQETVCVRLEFAYKGENQNDNTKDLLAKIDASLLKLAKQATGGDYSYLLHCERLGFNVGEDDKALEYCKKELVGKDMLFTTYVAKTSELLKGTAYDGVTNVHTDTRNYPSMNISYLLDYDDEQAAFDSMQGALLSRLDEGTYEPGRMSESTDKPKDEKPAKRQLPDFDEMKRGELEKFASDNDIEFDEDSTTKELRQLIKDAME